MQLFKLYRIHKKLFSARTFFGTFFLENSKKSQKILKAFEHWTFIGLVKKFFIHNLSIQFCRAKRALSFEVLFNMIWLSFSRENHEILKKPKKYGFLKISLRYFQCSAHSHPTVTRRKLKFWDYRFFDMLFHLRSSKD